MTIAEFFTDNPWIAWPAATLYAAECVLVIILVMQIFKHQ